jgi:hypothetical protein
MNHDLPQITLAALRKLWNLRRQRSSQAEKDSEVKKHAEVSVDGTPSYLEKCG